MSLEQDIQQAKFKSEKQKVFVNLLYTYHHLVSLSTSLFKDHNITRQQFNVLRILRGQHPKSATIGLIKERMLDKMSDASRIVERLRTKGLLERKTSTNDRRSAEVQISKNGLLLLEKIDPIIDQFEQHQIQLSDEESRSLNTLLDKLRGRN